MRSALTKLLITGLAAAVCALGYLNVWLAGTPVDASPISAPAVPGEGAVNSAVPPDSFGALDRFSETLARPLFRANRRIPAPDPVATIAETAPTFADAPSAIRLVGILVRSGSERRALIRLAGEPGATWAAVGGVVGGWKIGAIESTHVSVERGGTRADLNLFRQDKPEQENREK